MGQFDLNSIAPPPPKKNILDAIPPPPEKKKDGSVDFSHGYTPTASDIATKKSFDDLENRFDKDAQTNQKFEDMYSKLPPELRQQIDRVHQFQQVNRDRIRQTPKEEQEQQKAMDTTLGKVKKSVAYIGSQGLKGATQVLKGGAWIVNHLGYSGYDTQLIPDNAFAPIDKFTDLGVTPGQKAQIEGGKDLGMSAAKTLGMIANIAPAAVGGEYTELPKTAFALQGMGQGVETMNEVDPEHKVNPLVRDGFIAGTGAVNALIVGDMKKGILGEVSKPIQDNVVNAIVSDALRETVENNGSQEAFKKTLNDTYQKFVNNYAKSVSTAGVDLSAMQAANFALKKGVDATSDTPVFNENLGNLMHDISNTVTQQAPVFGAIGLAHTDDVEQQKHYLGKQIADLDEQIKSYSEKSEYPVKNAENEVNLEQAKSKREELNNKLKQLIVKQNEKNRKKSGITEENAQPPPTGHGDENAQESPDSPEKGVQGSGERVTEGGDEPPLNLKENATQKIEEQEGGGGEHQNRNESGETTETSGSDSPVSPETGEKTFSTKNAKIDENRQKRGLSPLMSEARKGFGKVWDNAMSKLDEDPEAGRKLVDELSEKPRATTDEENALLLHRQIQLQNDYEKLSSKYLKAKDEGEDTSDIKQKLDAASDDLQKVEEVSRKVGTETARGLNARKMMAKDDFSLASLETRKRIANGGRQLTDEERADIAKVHEEYQEKEKAYEAKIAELEERNRKLEEDATIRDLKAQAKKEGKAITRTQRAKQKADLVQNIRNKLLNSRQTLGSRIPVIQELVEIAPDLAKLAKIYIAEGIDKLDDLVDKIHDDIKDVFDNLEKRQVRDAISGYGKVIKMSQKEVDVKLRELKSQARAISALEDAKEGELPLKSGFQRDKMSDKVRELQSQIREAMKQMGIGVKTQEEHLKTALDAVKTRLKNQIKDLTKQIETGIKPPEKTQIEYDEEAKKLKAKRDALKEQLSEIDKPGMSDAQKLKNALAATQRSLDEYNRRIKEKDLSARKRETSVNSPELEKLRAERDKAKEEFEELKNAANPKLTPEQRALKSLKTRVANQIAEYQRKLKDKDFSKQPKKPPIELDPEAMKAKAELERVKDDYEAELEKDRLANRGKWEKGLDKFLKYRRAELLLNLSGAAKVGMASAYRILGQPLHEIAGSALRQIPGLKGIAEKAPREGAGFVPDVEWKALKTVWNADTLAEVKKKLKGKLDDIDTNFGDKKEHYDTSLLLDLAGNIHAAEKEFAKQNEFRRSVLLRTRWAEEHGIDTQNPFAQIKIGMEALKDANRQIFMGDNLAHTAYRTMLNSLENSKKFPGAGKNAATALKVLLPIVKVPTNFLLEKVQYTPVLGALKAFNIMRKGLDKMTPEQADYVMRIMKKQSLGVGLMAIGYLNPQAFGGFNIPGKKREEGDLKANDIKVFGVSVPHFLTHTPLLTLMQLGATMRRASAEETILGTAADYGESTPFYETPKQAVRAMENSTNMNQFVGGFVRGLLVPSAVSQVAEYFDKDKGGEPIRRSPKTIGQGIEEGIPGLRQNVPERPQEANFNKVTVGDKTYHLTNKQIDERQKFYDEYLNSDDAKELQDAIKDAKPVEKKKLQKRLHTAASKYSKQKLLQEYYNPETNEVNLQEDEN